MRGLDHDEERLLRLSLGEVISGDRWLPVFERLERDGRVRMRRNRRPILVAVTALGRLFAAATRRRDARAAVVAALRAHEVADPVGLLCEVIVDIEAHPVERLASGLAFRCRVERVSDGVPMSSWTGGRS